MAFERGNRIIVALGSLPEADPTQLRAHLDEAGLAPVDAQVTLMIGGTKELPGNQ